MRTYPNRPWVGLGVIIHKDNFILLIKRAKAPNKNHWSLPGGAQNLGETVFDGALREVLEETAIQGYDPQLVDVVDSLHYDEGGRITYHYTLIEVSALYHSGTAQALDDAADCTWVPITDLNRYDLPDDTIHIIHKSCEMRGIRANR